MNDLMNLNYGFMKKIFVGLCFLVCSVSAFSQVRLEDCLEKTKANYPLVKQYDLIEKSAEYSIQNATRNYIPQLNVSGKASYQSEATTMPFSVPGIGQIALPKDQYQVVAEVQQIIWDGGNVKAAKDLVRANTEQAIQQVNTNMYALNEKVNQIFFGILMLDCQIEQNKILRENLERNLSVVESCFSNGTAMQADVDAVKVELLNAEQQNIKMQYARKSYIDMLSLFTGEKYTGEETFEVPQVVDRPDIMLNNRPELQLFTARENTLNTREKSIYSGFMPQFGIFLQGGYGNPGLDMFKDEFRPFYIAGVRFSWNFGKLYTLKNDKRDISTNRLLIDAERNAFLLNTRIQAAGEDRNIDALKEQIRKDEEIVALRTRIRQAAEAEHTNGTMSVTDMLTEINKEYIARITLECRKIELVMSVYKLKNTLNS